MGKLIENSRNHINYLTSGGVRKHLWRLAYPEKFYFVGELMSMSQFSPKMVFRKL